MMRRELMSMLSDREIRSSVRSGKIRFAGNKKLKIYGRLLCASGKRMKSVNRVFFFSEEEALREGYRPCGRCLPDQYRVWKTYNTRVRM